MLLNLVLRNCTQFLFNFHVSIENIFAMYKETYKLMFLMELSIFNSTIRFHGNIIMSYDVFNILR